MAWIQAGEWLDYSIKSAGSGTYQPIVRVAGPGTGGRIRFRFELGGKSVGNTVSTTPTASYTTWKSVAGPEIPVGLGTHELKLVAVSGGFNVNWIDFTDAKALPAGALIADRFSNSSSVREVGDTLNGVRTQVGYRTWSATSGAGFAQGL